jgi:uncharacterized protein (DUF433 family)
MPNPRHVVQPWIEALCTKWEIDTSDNPYADYPGVVVRLGRVGGRPTLGESRVPAELIAECLDEGETAERVAGNYDLKLADVLKFKLYRDSNKPAVAQP